MLRSFHSGLELENHRRARTGHDQAVDHATNNGVRLIRRGKGKRDLIVDLPRPQGGPDVRACVKALEKRRRRTGGRSHVAQIDPFLDADESLSADSQRINALGRIGTVLEESMDQLADQTVSRW